MKIKDAPERIWLVLGDEVNRGDKFDDFFEVSWCVDSQFHNDIEYVRADLVSTFVRERIKTAPKQEPL